MWNSHWARTSGQWPIYEKCCGCLGQNVFPDIPRSWRRRAEHNTAMEPPTSRCGNPTAFSWASEGVVLPTRGSRKAVISHRQNTCPLLGTVWDSDSSLFRIPPQWKSNEGYWDGRPKGVNIQDLHSVSGESHSSWSSGEENQHQSLSKCSWLSFLPSSLIPCLPMLNIPPAQPPSWEPLATILCSQTLNCLVGIFHSDIPRDLFLTLPWLASAGAWFPSDKE